MKRSNFIPSIGVLLLAILACQPGPIGSPTATPPPQDTAAPVATLAPTEPAAQQYYTEEFDKENSNWSNFVIDDSIQLTSPGSMPALAPGDVEGVSVTTTNGHLVFDLERKGLWAYTTYDAYEYDDVRLDVVAENRGVNNNNVSLICRYSKEDGWYEFNVANSGLFNILYGSYTPDNQVNFGKIADGGSNKLKQGKEINNYGISCKGRTLILYINGFEVRRLNDNQYVLKTGKVGVSVTSFNDLPVKVEVDSVKISQP
jgi:hypothetical protein